MRRAQRPAGLAEKLSFFVSGRAANCGLNLWKDIETGAMESTFLRGRAILGHARPNCDLAT
jgi:hypothetical protein